MKHRQGQTTFRKGVGPPLVLVGSLAIHLSNFVRENFLPPRTSLVNGSVLRYGVVRSNYRKTSKS